MRKTLVAMFVVAAIVAAPAIAGEMKSGKCTYETQECLNAMAAKMKERGWIGIDFDKNKETGVLSVREVVAGSPAEKSGLKVGDVLYAIDGIVWNEENKDKIHKAKKSWKAGTSISYTIKRDGYDRKASLTLAPMPADMLAKYIGQHMLEHAAVEVAAK
jgi:C-terminal processing protease CtpA/Prc